MTEFTLTAPIQAHGETVTKLQFQPLKARHLRLCGDPFIRLPRGETKIDNAVMAVLIAELAQIPVSSVDQLEPADFADCSTMIVGFWMGPPPPTS